MSQDAIVVGGGPAGLLAASRIAENGHNVLVLEEHPEIGKPDHCAGLLSSSGLKSLGLRLPDEIVQNTVSGARIYAPSGHSILIERGRREAFVIDRRRFDSWLAQKASSKGAKISTDCKVSTIGEQKDGLRAVLTKEKEYQTPMTVVAEGSRSVLTKQVGLSTVSKGSRYPAYQYEVKGVELEEDLVEMFYGRRIAPGFFAWIIPLGDGRARVGLASKNRSKIRLDAALRNHPIISKRLENVVIERGIGGTVLVGKPLSKISGGGIVAVGDAAGMVKATTGGGVIIGGLTALEAGKTVNEALVERNSSKKSLSRYDNRCKSQFYRELETMYLAQRALSSLSDKGLDSVIKDAHELGLLSIVRKEGDMDMQGRVIRKLISDPRMFLVGLKALRYINPFL
ncbi:MAG: geranylgeranyl reductase family protein [Candidatus Thorarchaeota archaeon]